MGKMADRPFLSSDKRAARPLALVHTDLIGPMPVEPRSCAKYVLTFIDDHSGYALVAFIRNKDATAQHFKSMACWAETFTGQSLTSVHSDRGGEFLGKELQTFFSSRGITHQTSVPHTPQQNGQAERFNRTLLEKAEAIRQHACLPRSFWQDAVETALHIYNRQPMRCHQWRTPIEVFNGDKPDVSYFRVFGSHAYVFIPPEQQRDKLSPKAKEMVFIGYEPNTKGYRFWSTAQHRVFISTHVLFDETIFPFCSRNQTDGPTPIPVKEERPIAYDESSEEPRRNPEPSQDHYIQVPLGINNPNQDPSDAGHASDHTRSSSSYPTWRPFLGNELDTPSPLFLDSPEPSTSPPPYRSSPLHPPTKLTNYKEQRCSQRWT